MLEQQPSAPNYDQSRLQVVGEYKTRLNVNVPNYNKYSIYLDGGKKQSKMKIKYTKINNPWRKCNSVELYTKVTFNFGSQIDLIQH